MDIALKQRLVGASVLIALAVVVLPMLLGGRPEGSVAESQKIELPPQPQELDFETRRYPIGESPTPAGSAPAEPTVKPLPSPETTARVENDAAAVPAQSADTTADPSPAEASAPERSASSRAVTPPVPGPDAESAARYVVQVASFGSMDNANRLSKKLKGYGYSVLLDSIKSDIGTLHRVRVGPFPTESAANETVIRINSQIDDVKPRAMDLQPEKSAPVTMPSDPLVRWVVQVGSFSNTANADKLVDRLRQDKLSAFKEEVSSAGTRIYRVRIGPFLEREEAIRVNGQVNDRLDLDGVVMSIN